MMTNVGPLTPLAEIECRSNAGVTDHEYTTLFDSVSMEVTLLSKVSFEDALGFRVASGAIVTGGGVSVLTVITAVTNSDSPAGRAAACIDAANEYVPGASTPLGMDHRHDVFTSCDRPQAKPVYVEHVHWMVTPPWQLPVLCSQLAASSSGSREEHASRMTVSLMLTVRFPPARIGCKRARRRVTSISAEPHCPFIQPKARNR
jgi:hypothetical protein